MPKPIVAILTRDDAFHLHNGERGNLSPLWLDRPLPAPRRDNVWPTERKIAAINGLLAEMGK